MTSDEMNLILNRDSDHFMITTVVSNISLFLKYLQ